MEADDAPYDICIIGGGVVGLAICRAATLQGYNVVVVERENDLLSWASGNNSGILCTGVDAAIGTLERTLIRDSMSQVRSFYKTMNLPMRPVGSLVCQWKWDTETGDNSNLADGVSTNDDDIVPPTRQLQHVLDESHGAGDMDTKYVTPNDIQNDMEPNLSSDCIGAIHIPGEIVVDPWLHGIAYAVQSRQHGATIHTRFEMDPSASNFDEETKLWTIRRRIRKDESTTNEDSPPTMIRAKVAVSATGLWADEIQKEIISETEPKWSAQPRRGQYRVYQPQYPDTGRDGTDHNSLVLQHPIQPIPTDHTKGIFIFTTLYNQLVVGPTAVDQESKTDRIICPRTAEQLDDYMRRIVSTNNNCTASYHTVGEYVGIRPGINQRDYQIHMGERNWCVCTGIRSTGLTASLAIGDYIVRMLQQNNSFSSVRSNSSATTKPLPNVKELAKQYRESIDGTVTIHGFMYKVTHPLTKIGFQSGLGILR